MAVSQFLSKLFIAGCFFGGGCVGQLMASTLTKAENKQENNQLIAPVESYQPKFFVQYSPQTAFDMVMQLPGFTLVETESDIRGFASGAGNVLIDGRRPTTKSGGIEDTLSRIPASQVAYIEVIRGASGSADAAGQAVVANVIQIKDQTAKRWQLGLGKASDSDFSPSIEWLLSKQINGWDSALKLNAAQENTQKKGKIWHYSASGQNLNKQTETAPSTLNDIFLSGDLARQFNSQQRLSINARAGWSQLLIDTDRDISELSNNNYSTATSVFNNQKDSQFYTGELGIEWQQMLQSWQWRVLSINNMQNWFVDSGSSTYVFDEVPESVSNMRFDEHKSEHVLRSLISKNNNANQGGMRQEYGVEIAVNQLDSWLKIWTQDKALSAPARGSFAQVQEIRSEIFTNLTWQSEKLMIEGGLAAEYSKIQVSGDSRNEQSLTFLKPSLAVIYNASQTTQYRWDTRRIVGQLDFSDFAASADLVNDREFSGNPSLKPDSKIRTAIAFDHRFSDKGAISIEAYYEWRQDVLEHMILPSGDYAVGNAGDAQVKGINFSLNLPLFEYIPGAQLSLTAKFVDSTFDDTVTGESRQLSDLMDPDASLDFRQDLSRYQISWGIGYQLYDEYESFYVNEYNHYKTQGRWNAFIEGFIFQDVKLNLSITNLGSEKQRWQRHLYQNSRLDKAFQYQITEHTQAPLLSLSVSQTF